MKYRSILDAMTDHLNYVSPSGDGYVETYEYKLTKNGEEELVISGKKNLYEEIQAYKESTEIANILTRFINGETDVLNAVPGAYFDATDMPTSYAEYFARVKEAQHIFDQLPDDIKAKFDNDAEKFFLEFGTDSFVDKVNGDKEIIDNSNQIMEDFDNAE